MENPFEPPSGADERRGPNPWLKWFAPLMVFAIVAWLAVRSFSQEPPESEKDCVSRCVRNNLDIPEDEPAVRSGCVQSCKDFQRGDLDRSDFRED